MATKVHRPTEAKANEKSAPESNLTQPSRQSQLKINSFFREAHQKIRSEVEGIEHRIKVSLPEFESYEHTLYSGSEPDYWYLLCVRIEIPPYAMLGEFGVTHTRQVQTLREPYLMSSGRGARDEGILGLSKQELDALGLWSAGKKNSLMNPSQHVVVPSKVQALAWYCRLLALREFLQRLDLRMEKQLTQASGETAEPGLRKPVREGKQCAKVIEEIKRIKTMYNNGMSMKEIKEAWPRYEVWKTVAGLSKEDREVFEKPAQWGAATGYAKLILSKCYGNSPDTITDWVKAYKKHEKSKEQKN